MAKKDKDRERIRQQAKRSRRKQTQIDWMNDASLSEAERETGQRLAEEFMRSHAPRVRDLDDLERHTHRAAAERVSDWERVHGPKVASYAYRQVSLERVGEMYRHHYSTTREWYQSRNPPPGRRKERLIGDVAFVIVLLAFFAMVIGNLPK